MKPLLIADLFCGAGGSSTGCRLALAARKLAMKLVAVNHWPVAVETHRRNHPDAEHYCVDVYRTNPREAVPGGYLDLLMASPTCTFHSRARGGRPVSREQRYGRMTPTQVLRWVRQLTVRCLLVENVPEFRDWGPLHPDKPGARISAECRKEGCARGKACRRRKSVYFDAWVRRLERAGFAIEWRVLNAADYGDATTRQRLFLIGRSDGAPITWPTPTHSKTGGAGLKRWRAAREVINFLETGASIFGRAKPYSQKTLARILAGAIKFAWPATLIEMIREHKETGRDPRGRQHPDIEMRPAATAFMLSRHAGGAPRTIDEPTPTQVAKHSHMLVEPMVATYYGNGGCRSPSDPLPTVTTRDRFALVVPVTHAGTRTPRSSDEPLPTVTGANRGELAVAQPMMVVLRQNADGRSLDLPVPTVCAQGGHIALAQPFMPAAFGERPTQAPRVRSTEEPAPTVCAGGRIPLVQAAGWDVRMRMFQPAELAGAMGFSDHETTYEFCGTKTEVIRQIGNAVPVHTAAALVGAILGASAAQEAA